MNSLNICLVQSNNPFETPRPRIQPYTVHALDELLYVRVVCRSSRLTGQYDQNADSL